MENIITGPKMRFFKNEILNIPFENDGFVKFKLLNANQVDDLKAFYYNNVDEKQSKLKESGFHTTSNTGDNILLNEVDLFIKSILLPALEDILENVTFTISNFLVKEPNPNSIVPPHQDWLLVDESKYASFNIWICLNEANNQTGELKFIPGSHLLSNSHRANGMPRFFDGISKQLNPFFKYIPTKPGDCVIFNHSIIHASDNNKSEKKRLSCVLGGFSKDADLLFYLPDREKNGYLRKFHIQPSTLLNMGENYEPIIDVTLLEKVNGKFENWTYNEFIYQLKKKYPSTKLSFVDRIKLMFYQPKQST